MHAFFACPIVEISPKTDEISVTGMKIRPYKHSVTGVAVLKRKMLPRAIVRTCNLRWTDKLEQCLQQAN
jgi:hypothetical protein